mmetsp:Transcript_3323/g.7854  ORF Transcript_3323/g.7854 Transcript_3323/m.7854 type:complete len:165 (+) Transcript_3323:1453-1947(+)
MLSYRILAARRIQKFYLRRWVKKVGKPREEPLKDSSGHLLPTESRRISLRSGCSSVDIADISDIGSVSQQVSDGSVGARRPTLTPNSNTLLPSRHEEDRARQQQLMATMASLRKDVDSQGEALSALRLEMAQLPLAVAKALKGEAVGLNPAGSDAGQLNTKRQL